MTARWYAYFALALEGPDVTAQRLRIPTFRANRAEMILCPSPFLRRVLNLQVPPPTDGTPTMNAPANHVLEAAALSDATALGTVDGAGGSTAPRGTNNLRVSSFKPLPSPRELMAEQPLTAEAAAVVARGREEVRAV